MNGATQQNISFAEFELDAAHRQLWRDGKPLALYAKTFDLLEFLIERNGQVVTKNEILETVWEGQFVEEANLSVQVSALRKVLGEKKNEPRFLVTVPGKGYKFVAEIENGNREIVIEKHNFSRLVIEEGDQGNGQNIKSKQLESNRFYFYVLPAAFLLLCAVGGYWFFNNFNRAAENRALIVSATKPEKQPNIRRLTGKGRVNQAVLSPDGKFFAYSFYEIGSYRTELRLGQTDGGGDVALLSLADTVYNPIAFSADGGWLYYMQSEPRMRLGTLYKMPVLGGVPQKILSDINIYSAISPDEKQIAFIRKDKTENKSALVVANLDGTNERELAVHLSDQTFSSFSLSWSADGSMIAFGAETGEGKGYEVFTINTADGNITRITDLNWIELARLEWLKDGSGLLAVGRNKESARMTQIWQIDYPAGTVRRVVSDLSKYGSVLSLSADSSAFIAAQTNAESNIWIAPAGNLKEAKQITFGSLGRLDGWYGMDWTADGKIVYVAQIDQSMTLWTMDADGKNVRQITPLGFRDKLPDVSADGGFVVFESDRSGKNEIWSVEIDGSNLQQLTDSGGNSNPTLTPDGKWLVYRHQDGEKGSIWRVPLVGGEAVRLTFQESSAPRISPDGRFIACGYRADGKERSALAIVSIEGGEPLKLFDVPQTYNFDNAAIRWSPDGRAISYRDWSDGIWSQSIDGGEPRRLEGLPVEKFYTYGWSSDGKQFAFTRGREVRDVVLITDFR